MATILSAQMNRLDRRLPAAVLILALAVAAIYGQTVRYEFVTFDDDNYIRNNPVVSGGLSWQGFFWAFGYRVGNWHPLTWLSHMLDAQLFGLWAGGHHLMGAGFHAANAALLLGVLTALTGAFWRSAAVAALFALHPLRVESVAWVAERKDLLSGLFWLLTMGAYLGYARRPGLRRYFAALGLFALGLAAKPMLVTLPFALLVLDWWPLGRALPRREKNAPWAVQADPGRWWALFVEKTPFFVLSLLACLVTLRAQTLNVLPEVTPDLATRLANAAVSYLHYLGSFFWPESLAVLYPYPRQGIPEGVAAAAAAALALTSAAAFANSRRRPYLPAGWLWYLGTLVPVIGFVQVGGQARSDRYTYLPMIGFALALVWLAGDHWPLRTGARVALTASFVAVLAALAVRSVGQVRVWENSISLYEHTVRETRDNFNILNNLGSLLMDAGRNREAVAVLREEVRIKPEHCNAHYNLGHVLIGLGQYAEALDPLHRALECYEYEGRAPGYIADTHFNLGSVYNRLQRYSEAQRHYDALLRLVPNYPGGRAALDEVLSRQRSLGERPGRRRGPGIPEGGENPAAPGAGPQQIRSGPGGPGPD